MKTVIITDRARRAPRDERRGGHREGHRGPRGRGYGHESAPPSTEGLPGFLTGRLPWPDHELSVDRDEVTIVVTLDAGSDDAPADNDVAGGRISRWREETRDERIAIAREVEARWGRSVAWGAELGEVRELFTRLSVPVMTRLHQSERQVLDTLVDAGVARSRSDALAWSVRLVGQHADAWLGELRQALTEVERLRGSGPL
jgi:hypothetical protein